MKKFALAFLAVLALAVPVFADGDTTDYSYMNVSIYRVLENTESYIVVYGKQRNQTGQVLIPKSWLSEKPRRLNFRALPKQLTPYMTVIYEGGKFSRVILTMPTSRNSNYWGVLDASAQVGTPNKDTLEIEY